MKKFEEHRTKTKRLDSKFVEQCKQTHESDTKGSRKQTGINGNSFFM